MLIFHILAILVESSRLTSNFNIAMSDGCAIDQEIVGTLGSVRIYNNL